MSNHLKPTDVYPEFSKSFAQSFALNTLSLTSGYIVTICKAGRHKGVLAIHNRTEDILRNCGGYSLATYHALAVYDQSYASLNFIKTAAIGAVKPCYTMSNVDE